MTIAGKSPFSVGSTSSNGGFSIVMLVFAGINIFILPGNQFWVSFWPMIRHWWIPQQHITQKIQQYWLHSNKDHFFHQEPPNPKPLGPGRHAINTRLDKILRTNGQQCNPPKTCLSGCFATHMTKCTTIKNGWFHHFPRFIVKLHQTK